MSVQGTADVIVYRSTARGDQQRVAKQRLERRRRSSSSSCRLTPFVDGGWYWFDVVAGIDDAARRRRRVVTADVAVASPARISVGITTFNRPDYCVDLLRTRWRPTRGALDVLDKVFVVDQGTRRSRTTPGSTKRPTVSVDQLAR